ncbi:unnamed protein product [Rotaria socialis]|uniref:SUN domain-containing protein n=1 Tax=Rotaria socialis TaxID=392032 RepID=A0A817Q787_9BILA|nr:unnamed protein product [Rotaria socialis]CAF4382780.1 unnamed protein product [Rotaria socialis]
MIVCIRSIESSVLAICTISLFLCIQIPSIISTELVGENLNQTDENNQTGAIEPHILQSNGQVSSDLNLETKSSDIVLNDVAATISIETKSDITDEIPRPITTPLVDNQTNDDQQQTSPTKSNRSSINSFEEWKQQQLQADLLKKDEVASHSNVLSEPTLASSTKGNSSPTTNPQIPSKKGKLRKNFASGSCGAKILAHNAEAQNVPSILSSSPDEYMLNPCIAKIWFVIELCESIRVLNIEIANFELFSSVPKTFRVSSSDRYPTKDWHRHHLGTFNASSNRTIQSFQTMQSTTYVKYVKFELLDFHGHEHYCPLSVVRIHGSNVEEEIMTMEENTNLIDSKSLSNIPEDNENDDDDDNNLSNDQQVGGIIGSAILDLAKRVFRRPTPVRGITSATSTSTSTTITETNVLKTDCHPSVLSDSIINDTLKSWRQSDTFKQCISEFLHGLWSKYDTCTMYLSYTCFKLNYCCQCPLMTNHDRRDPRMLTLNLYVHPCGYYHILTNQLDCKKEKAIESNRTILTNLNHELHQNLNEKNSTVYNNDTIIINDESVNLSNNKSTLKFNNTLLNEINNIDHTLNRSSEQSLSNNISNETIMVLELQLSSNTANQSSFQSSTHETLHLDINSTEPSVDTNSIEEMVISTASTTVPPTANNNEALPPMISSPWLKGMLVNTKSLPELFKIIEKLNFNLTLSNRYLQELSQHYVKKLDETQQTTDLLLQASKAADKKLENLEEYSSRLQENINQMSLRLIKLEAWIPLIVFTIVCLFIWCLVSTCSVFQLQRKLKCFTNEHEKQKTIKVIAKHHFDDYDQDSIDDISFLFNGVKKRKLSTDSNDSNPNRSQRVPDLTLPKIKENGIHKNEHKTKMKHSKQTEHILTVTKVQT